MSEDHVSRREALTGGAAAIAGVGAALAVSTVTREAHADNASDATALNLVLTKTYEIIAIYDAAIGYLTDPTRPEGAVPGALLTRFRTQHRDQATRLVARITALSGTAVSDGAVTVPANPTGFMRSVGNYVKFAADLERKAAIASVATLNTIGNKDAAELVAAIVGTQTQQFTVLYLLARGIAMPGAMAATALDQIVPRSFVNLVEEPAVSLFSVAPLTFTP